MSAGIELLAHDAPRAQWLRARRAGLGGSDIAALLGESRWTSAYALWRSKVAEVPDEPSEAMHWGTVLEAPILADLAMRIAPMTIARQGLTRHAEHVWARYTPDGVLHDADGPAGIVEVKTSLGPRAHLGWDGDQIPGHVWLQVQWGLAVLDLPGTLVAALVTGPTLLQHEIERDDTACAQLLDVAGEWWQRHVVEGRPPLVDGHPATTDVLRRIPARTGSSIELDPAQLRPMLAEYRAARAALAAAKARAARAANELCALLGEHEEGLVHGEPAVSYRQHTRTAHTVAESTFRRLHVPEETL
jgi:putative phage-type endonuclease